jgi:hypothetical protein
MFAKPIISIGIINRLLVQCHPDTIWLPILEWNPTCTSLIFVLLFSVDLTYNCSLLSESQITFPFTVSEVVPKNPSSSENCVTFRCLYSEGLLVFLQIPMAEHRPLTSVRYRFISVYTASFDIWNPSATWGRVMPSWLGTSIMRKTERSTFNN